jgi:hypothetical protein
MKLRYISLGLEYNYYSKADNLLRYDFLLRTRFISNYFSREVRKYKIEVDGFNMLSIALLPDINNSYSTLTAINVLEVYLPFKRERYDLVRGTNDCNYYLELYELGFVEASKSSKIPLSILLEILHAFKLGGCLNEWTHKKKQFKSENLNIELKCEFDTNCFQLRLIISSLDTKEIVFNGIIARTEPDEVLFEKMFKDILIEDDKIIVTDNSDSPRFIINKIEAKLGKLDYQIEGRSDVKYLLTYGI